MARKLPWLAGGPKKGRNDERPEKSTAVKRRRIAAERLGSESDGETGSRKEKRTPRERRNASSSPPPAPPDEELMHEGLDADDGWRLVEDEFEMTAHLFTRHLHHAEYKRQKRLAEVRNQGAVAAITLSTEAIPGFSSPGLTRSKNAVAIKPSKNAEPSAKGDDPWLSDPRLAGLMSNKREMAPQQKINAMHSKSRAAYGYSKGQASPPKRRTIAPIIKQEASEVSEAYSDDLDAQPYREQSILHKSSSGALISQDKGTGSTQARASNVAPNASRQPLSKASSKHTGKSHRSSALDSDDDDGDDDLFGAFALRKNRTKTSAPVKKEIGHRNGDKTREQPVKADEIPTFLV